jgi:putative ABC transport system permease protein
MKTPPPAPPDHSPPLPAPPRIARRLGAAMAFYDREFFWAGDLEEEFRAKAATLGPQRARRWFRFQVYRSLPSYLAYSFKWSLIMTRNFLLTGLRNLRRYKIYSLINIAGLSVGLACTLLILLWVRNEMSFDGFHENADRLYRVVNTEVLSGGETSYFAQCSMNLAEVLKTEHPEVVETVRFRRLGRSVVAAGARRFPESGIAHTDPSIFTSFTYPLLHGDAGQALSNPNSIVISRRMASKYFPGQDPMGKVLNINTTRDFNVTGVMADIPANSHQQFDFLISFEAGLALSGIGTDDAWNTQAFMTYLRLADRADAAELGRKIRDVYKKHRNVDHVTASLQPIKDIHLRSRDIWGIGATGDIRYVVLFTLIAAFILLMACMNFMNLATARAGTRAKEVGIRKTVGAERLSLIGQFYGEAFLLAFLALGLGILLLYGLIPLFNAATGSSLAFKMMLDPAAAGLALLVTVMTGFLAGGYPALVLSSFKPVKVLRGTWSRGARGSFFRKILVFVQFVVTIVLVTGTLVISRQLRHIKNFDPGFDKDQVVCLDVVRGLHSRLETLRNEFLKNPGVLKVSAASDAPMSETQTSATIEIKDRPQGDIELFTYLLFTDTDYADLLGLEMAGGRYFSRDFPADLKDGWVINEAAARALKLKSPVGEEFEKKHIIGVIKDYNNLSLHSSIAPLLISYDPAKADLLLVKIRAGAIPGTMRVLESAWNKVASEFPFQYEFLDDRIDAAFKTDRRIEKLVNAFTALALIVACLGLYGLTAFTAERRRREIGIRRVLGATTSRIVLSFGGEFGRAVLLSNLVAAPIAFLAANGWLRGFAYRISLSPAIFILGGVLTLAVAALAVVFQSLKAAHADPVESLRWE